MQEEPTEPTDAQTPDAEIVETEAAPQEVEATEEFASTQDEPVAGEVQVEAAEENSIDDNQPETDQAESADTDDTKPAADTEPSEAETTEEQPDDEPAPADIEDNEDDAEEQDTEVPEDFEATLETVIESVLFASDEPLSPKRLVDIAEAGSVKAVNKCVRSLNKTYRDDGRAFRIEKISGGYQMMTLSIFNPWISKLIKVRSDNKLSPAALEALAIVAYKQPIIRADVEAIRGVASGEVLRNLMYKGLVKIVGRAEILGRPMLYGTTKKFLDIFGLNNLKDLPKIEELKKPE